ncbi:MAG: endolytic transglycosylase MltG [Paludibacteraceae bacterium]|nr:endolytic transglycosylase MltG [Paludibacteraceae bacterium]
MIRKIRIWCGTFAGLLALVVAVGLGLGYISGQNVQSLDGEQHLVYVYPETTEAALLAKIEETHRFSLPFLYTLQAKYMRLTTPERPFIKTGCYRLEPVMSDRELIQMFRSGRQTPVKLMFRGVRTQGQLAKMLADQLMIDSASIASRLQDSTYMRTYGLNVPNAVCLFIPNTYEVWWNMSADDLFARMSREHKTFWNEKRRGQAAKMGLTPEEVVTLASIVEEETWKDVDKPVIAGLYLNRLRRGMLLQACPTVKFALGDFTLKRVLNEHLRYDSPYNTYLYPGLPPGPIRIPTPKTVDLTLNYTPSDYLYMCASPALDGTHRFARTYPEHMRNARDYQREMNRRGIH